LQPADFAASTSWHSFVTRGRKPSLRKKETSDQRPPVLWEDWQVPADKCRREPQSARARYQAGGNFGISTSGGFSSAGGVRSSGFVPPPQPIPVNTTAVTIKIQPSRNSRFTANPWFKKDYEQSTGRIWTAA
jgi:hypothetical protein